MGEGEERDPRADVTDLDTTSGGPGAGTVDLVRALGALIIDPGAGAAVDVDTASPVVSDEEDGHGTAR